jgi:hypothetical protein
VVAPAALGVTLPASAAAVGCIALLGTDENDGDAGEFGAKVSEPLATVQSRAGLLLATVALLLLGLPAAPDSKVGNPAPPLLRQELNGELDRGRAGDMVLSLAMLGDCCGEYSGICCC